MFGKLAMGLALALGAAGSVQAAPGGVAPVQVVVLGTYHMGNPGRDLHNVVADDVRTPKRQAELQRLVRALAAFRPTKVMVEADGVGDDLVAPGYARFTTADFAKSRNETVQIGYRLAHEVGLQHVQGIDVEGDFPYGPLAEWAEKHGRKAELDALGARMGQEIAHFNTIQPTRSIAELLSIWNQPSGIVGGNDFYYRLLSFGDAKEQPGALLNAAWYQRNARIFARLVSVARPGDRIVVVYGAGHGYWLRHFAHETPGFTSVNVLPYLKRAK